MSEMISQVRLTDVRKVFGRYPALSGVTCTLAPGQLSLLMGPNGAGKSTLLTILSTLSRPTAGQVLYSEWDHRYAEEHLRGRIGFVAHAPMLYRQMSSRENLVFFARMYGVDQPKRAVDLWLNRVGMGQAADKPVQQLSRGMVQRIALARALLPNPDVLLLDEPFTGLDQAATDLLRQELRTAMTAGKILALVSHDVEAVDGLCGRLLLLNRGRVVQDIAEPQLSAKHILECYRGTV